MASPSAHAVSGFGSSRVQLTSVSLPFRRKPSTLAKRGGVVPVPPPATTATDPTEATTGDALIFHGRNDAPPTTTTSRGSGPIITNVPLQLLFWGSAWNSNPAPSITQVTDAVNSILRGPYLDGLVQYGVVGGGLSGAWIVTGVEPKNPVSTDDVRTIIDDLIDQGSFPSPGTAGGKNLYMFVLPANIPTDDGEAGLHTFSENRAWFGFLTHNGTLDSLTSIFSHELVEACTDPEGDGFQVDPRNNVNWHEIADVCSSTTRLGNVLVQSYWSQQDRACIIPVLDRKISIAPQSLGFGKIHVRDLSEPRPLAITNTGTSRVNVFVPQSPHTVPLPAFSWDNAGNHQLDPGAALQIHVTFSPTTVGSNAGELRLTSSAFGSPFVVALTGEGVAGSPL